MANSRYIKGQQTGSLPEYLQGELRRIEMMFLPIKWIDVTFENLWVNFGGSFQTVQYSLDTFGVVRIRGLTKNGNLNASVFTLPAGFRPPADLIFAAASTTGAAECYIRVDVNSNGTVVPRISGAATNGFVSLNIQFTLETK